jgi:hypothetical protein
MGDDKNGRGNLNRSYEDDTKVSNRRCYIVRAKMSLYSCQIIKNISGKTRVNVKQVYVSMAKISTTVIFLNR